MCHSDACRSSHELACRKIPDTKIARRVLRHQHDMQQTSPLDLAILTFYGRLHNANSANNDIPHPFVDYSYVVARGGQTHYRNMQNKIKMTRTMLARIPKKKIQ